MKKQKNQVDAFINEVLDEDKKAVKTVLTIPYQPDNTDKVVRVTDEQGGSTLLYASTRLGTLTENESELEAEVTINENLAGKVYELKVQGSDKIVQHGKISVKAAASKVYEMSRTGTE